MSPPDPSHQPRPNPVSQGDSNRKKSGLSLKTAIRLGIAVVVVAAVIYTLLGSVQSFRQRKFDFSSVEYRWWILAVFSYIITMFCSSVFWHQILIAFRQRPIFGRSLLAFYASQLGKYVPGKAMVVVIRTDLIRGPKVKVGPAAASVFVETLSWIFTGSLVGGVLIVWLYPDQWWLKLTAGSMALFSGILTLPPVFNSVASFVISRKKVAVDLDGLGFATMFRGWGILTLGWIFNGLSLWLILKGMPGIEVRGDDFWLTLASVSLATSAGFISLLPGGLGVRELVMIPLLGARFDPATAVLAAVIIRLVWLIAELLTSGNIFLIRWLKFRSSR